MATHGPTRIDHDSHTANHQGADMDAALDRARPRTAPVALVRYRPGISGETARVVHVVALPTDEQAGVVGASCGAALLLDDVETVIPGEGMPCTMCVVNRVVREAAPVGELPVGVGGPDHASAVEPAASDACYPAWGWPVTVHRDQMRLSLDRDVSALAIPIPLGVEVIEILTWRRCAPAVLAHPDTPDHHIILAGERYGVPLPWPGQVHRVTGVLLLPPTVTPRGPVTWVRPPQEDSLRLCREIDVFGALRTALSDLSPGESSQ